MAGKKPDLERTGLFKESSYIGVGDPYKDRRADKPFNEKAYKGKQLMTSSQSGFFNPYQRVFEGEAYHDPVAARRKESQKEKAKLKAGAFVPPAANKSHPYFDTFGGKIEALSPQQRPQPKKKQEARNFVTNPAKKGTGYGYAGVTLSSEIKYAPEPYDAAKEMENKARKQDKAKVKGKAFTVKTAKKGDVFDKNPYTYDGKLPKVKATPSPKKPAVPFVPTSGPRTMKGGGKHMGTFSKFEYKPEKFKPKEPPKRSAGPAFRPSGRSHSLPSKSVTSYNVTRSVNSSNFSSIKI